jgi:hypothetical protein
MQERGAIRDDIDPYTTAYLMTVFVMGTTAMDGAMPPEAVPPFEELLRTMGDMMDSYLSSGSPEESDTGKSVIRELMDRAREEIGGE